MNSAIADIHTQRTLTDKLYRFYILHYMSNFSHYTTEDFLENDSFRCWVLSPTPELDLFWNGVITENPEKSVSIKKAKLMLTTMELRFKETLPEEFIRQDIRNIMQRATKVVNPASVEPAVRSLSFNWLKIAASILLFVGAGWWFLQRDRTGSFVIKTNDTDAAMTILLEDSSVVILQKGGSLSYPAHFTMNKREVKLQGEAFFEISKNPDKPFLVYANETVTKVWGTSFTIRAFENDNTVRVAVKTGKVSVYSLNKPESNTKKTDNGEVYLLPNEQVTFNRTEQKLSKTVSKNSVEAQQTAKTELVYEDTPVSEILQNLEENYGIDIIFDQKLLSGCLLNTQFKGEYLNQKLLTICKAIGATYEITNGKITITAKGCDA